MAIDDTKLLFSSNWDIDQVVKSGTTNITVNGSNETVVADFSDLGLTYNPQFFVSWRRVGKTRWNMLNASSGFEDATYASDNYLYPIQARVQNNKLYVRGDGVYIAASLDIRWVIYRSKAG